MRRALLVAMTIGLATNGEAQSSDARLHGRVIDAASRAPLPGAQLLLLRGALPAARRSNPSFPSTAVRRSASLRRASFGERPAHIADGLERGDVAGTGSATPASFQ